MKTSMTTSNRSSKEYIPLRSPRQVNLASSSSLQYLRSSRDRQGTL